MREIEIVAKTRAKGLEKAEKRLEIDKDHLEIIEEYEPDEIDLKQHQEEEGLDAPLSPEEATLFVIRVGFSHYTRLAEEWTNGLMERFAPGASARAERFRNIIIIRLQVPETSILIGKKGATLDALQHVVVRALLTEDESFPDVMLDVEGYRERKLVRLEKEARQAADKAARTGRRIPLSPMSPAERKFIHNLLKDSTEVKTESRGQDRSRHILIEPLKTSYRGGGGNKRGGGKKSHGGVLPRGKHQAEITEEQRQLLYGKAKAAEEEEYEAAQDALGEEGHSILPEYIPPDESEEDEDDDRLVDEIE